MDASSTTSPGTSGQRPGVLQDVRSLARELRGLFHDQVGLAALETRQAGESLVWMIILGVLVGGLLLSAWIGLLAAVVVALIAGGVAGPSVAILLAVSANVLLAVILGWAIRSRLPHLQFPATVRSLTPDTEKSS